MVYGNLRFHRPMIAPRSTVCGTHLSPNHRIFIFDVYLCAPALRSQSDRVFYCGTVAAKNRRLEFVHWMNVPRDLTRAP